LRYNIDGKSIVDLRTRVFVKHQRGVRRRLLSRQLPRPANRLPCRGVRAVRLRARVEQRCTNWQVCRPRDLRLEPAPARSNRDELDSQVNQVGAGIILRIVNRLPQ